MGTVAELIDNLFRTHRKPNGREYTHKEVCEAIGTLSPSHLSKLRNGTITNPGRDVLLSLCQFFRVPSSFFFPELEAMPIAQPDDHTAQTLARASKASLAVRRKLEALLEAALDDALGTVEEEGE
ncbi:helix-turn-helix domain-containing protein [Herpetosiphon giganteus]|uniref:helix-turn-helix domain-containing protein n=1 Tax=Herpetosiphon giganteus TaxID=2029754 RepID=UPI00195D496C|nr:helix-turn-helix transcriptional regulator [Herpetosiphon giganteus]MBM7846671.1 transcriptional regulator with XRE-family HTH domain [Herpetosiphon giganteus]